LIIHFFSETTNLLKPKQCMNL